MTAHCNVTVSSTNEVLAQIKLAVRSQCEITHSKLTTNSPVNLKKDPPLIATEFFSVDIGSIKCLVKHTKSLEKSTHWKVVKLAYIFKIFVKFMFFKNFMELF